MIRRKLDLIFLAIILGGQLIPSSFGLSNVVWPNEPKVVAKPTPLKGDGVFADEPISQGSFVCRYHGKVLTIDEEEKLYPDRYPDYCLRVSSKYSIDGQDSGHWSRLINHNENFNLKLHTDEEALTAHFTASRDIEIGEELCFDYGVAYFIFRQITPAPGTETRSLELAREKASDVPTEPLPPPPRSPTEIQRFMESSETDENKKSTLMRALDFYGGVRWLETEDQLELLSSLDDGSKRIVSFSTITMEELVTILETLWYESEEEKNNQ